MFVGIDWAAETHAICVEDAKGRVVDRFTIDHSAEGPAIVVLAVRHHQSPSRVAALLRHGSDKSLFGGRLAPIPERQPFANPSVRPAEFRMVAHVVVDVTLRLARAPVDECVEDAAEGGLLFFHWWSPSFLWRPLAEPPMNAKSLPLYVGQRGALW